MATQYSYGPIEYLAGFAEAHQRYTEKMKREGERTTQQQTAFDVEKGLAYAMRAWARREHGVDWEPKQEVEPWVKDAREMYGEDAIRAIREAVFTSEKEGLAGGYQDTIPAEVQWEDAAAAVWDVVKCCELCSLYGDKIQWPGLQEVSVKNLPEREPEAGEEWTDISRQDWELCLSCYREMPAGQLDAPEVHVATSLSPERLAEQRRETAPGWPVVSAEASKAIATDPKIGELRVDRAVAAAPAWWHEQLKTMQARVTWRPDQARWVTTWAHREAKTPQEAKPAWRAYDGDGRSRASGPVREAERGTVGSQSAGLAL